MALEKDFAAFEEAIIRVGREYDVFLYGSGGRMPADGRRRLQSDGSGRIQIRPSCIDTR